jgi:hypothetical protein
MASEAAEEFENRCSGVEERAFRPVQVSWNEPGLQPLRSQFDAEGDFSATCSAMPAKAILAGNPLS